ncbi:MAG: hypothetical protein ACKOD5_08235 [Chthoniobacterales bacterium]
MSASTTQAKRVSDEICIAATTALSVPDPRGLLRQGPRHPLKADVLLMARQTAARVAQFMSGLGHDGVVGLAPIRAFIRNHVYTPAYPHLA